MLFYWRKYISQQCKKNIWTTENNAAADKRYRRALWNTRPVVSAWTAATTYSCCSRQAFCGHSVCRISNSTRLLWASCLLLLRVSLQGIGELLEPLGRPLFFMLFIWSAMSDLLFHPLQVKPVPCWRFPTLLLRCHRWNLPPHFAQRSCITAIRIKLERNSLEMTLFQKLLDIG